MASKSKKESSKNMPTGSLSDSSGHYQNKRKKDEGNDKLRATSELSLISWNEIDKGQVRVVLESERRLGAGDIDSSFTNTSCLIKLNDVIQWKCDWSHDIDHTQSKIMLSGKKNKSKIFLQVSKKDPSITWSTLEKVRASTSAAQAQTSPRESEASTDKNNTENQNTESEQMSEKEQDPVVNLLLVKHDWYERSGQTLAVTIFVKSINRDSVRVNFEKRAFSVKFKTSNPKFLSLYQGSSEDTVFLWELNVYDNIVPDLCKYKVMNNNMELILRKKEEKKWTRLEEKATLPPAPCTSAWTSTSKKSGEGAFSAEKEKNAAKDKVNAPSPSTSKDFGKGNSYGGSKLKPTCMVPPLSRDDSLGQIVTPGFTGLTNLGNTCFMNSVIQVLANTRELRDYFLGGRFKDEINTDNPLGSGGKLALAFAVLLKVLWSGTHHSYAPSKLKALVAQKASQFTGYAQHDAQEFMAFLLDGLHEDVNRIYNKPYTETVNSDGRPDEVVANEAWDVHKKRNDSLIVDLFQGQYKSTLVCPVCGKVSITFDPFMILPVPLPKKQRHIAVIFFAREPYKKPVRYMLALPKASGVENLKEAVFAKTGVKPKNLRIFEVYKSKIFSLFTDNSSLSQVTSSDVIFVFEVLSKDTVGEPVVELAVIQRAFHPIHVPTKCAHCKEECTTSGKLKKCTGCFKVSYCGEGCQRADWAKHKNGCRYSADLVGQPFILSLPKSQATFSKVCQMMETFAMNSVNVFQPPIGDTSKSSGSEAGSKTPSPTPGCHTVASNPDETSDTDTGMTPINSYESLSSLDPLLSPPGVSCTSDENTGSFSPTSQRDTSNLSIPPSPCTSNTSETTDEPSHTSTDLGIHLSQESSSSKEIKGEDEKEACSPVERSPPNNTPLKVVMGRSKEAGSTPLFFIKPCDKDGKSSSSAEADRLQDLGDEPLNLSDSRLTILAIDWKNSERSRPYVLVQTKEMEIDEDVSVKNCVTEENSCTLGQCLSLFTDPEVLSPEHAWYCPRCKDHREATKQLSIWRLPHTLIIQLKRFSFRNLLWRDKIDKMVQFPTRGLDLDDYYIGSRPADEPPAIYDLYGVINHYGNILGGHYTAYGRCPDLTNPRKSEVEWRCFDDSNVQSKQENHVVTHGAYVLFYRRRTQNDKLLKSINLQPKAKASSDQEEESENDSKLPTEDNRWNYDVSSSYTDMEAVD